MRQNSHTKYDLFISYAEDDRSWVYGYLLPELGLPSERVITPKEFTPGAPLLQEFSRAVNESRFTVLVLTPAYHADEWAVYGEQISSFASVKEGQDRLIPLCRQPTELPLDVAFRVSLDCTESAQWKTELGRLRDLLGQPEPPLETLPCPYPGIEPFSEKNAKFYVGREVMVHDVVNRLHKTWAVTIIGPSGCGKSSFMRAGLVPFLKYSISPNLVQWMLVDIRPGPQPFERLSAALAKELCKSAEEVSEALRTGTISLSTYLTQIAAGQPNRRLVFIVDQFEEAFTLCKDSKQRDLFFIQLQDLFDAQPEHIFLMIAVRSDFYGDCQKSLLWPNIEASLVNLLPLTPADLKRAIVEPAHSVGVFIEPALVERLIADAEGEPGALPLLQETLKSLWDNHLRRRLLALADYAVMDSAGHTGLQTALDAHAKATLAQLIGDQKRDIARRIFIRLVEFGEQRRNTRRQQPEDALHADGDPEQTFRDVLEFLIDQRLLTVDRDSNTGKALIDLAHEALIDSWAQLGEWIESFHVLEEGRRSLVLAASIWDVNKKDSSYLFSGRRLKKANEWAQQWRSELGKLEMAFLEQSLIQQQRHRRLLVGGAVSGTVALIIILWMSIPVWISAAQHESIRKSTGTALVYIDGGQAIIGSDDPNAGPRERLTKPALQPFSIEKYEVSVEQYKTCVDFGPCEKPRIPDILADTSHFDHPITHVSARQAETYCLWLGRRLPTSVEWERAARGKQGRLWPWGNEAKGCDEFVFGCGIIAVTAGEETATPPPERIYHLASNVSEWVVLVPNNCEGDICHLPWDGKTDQIAHMGNAWDIGFARISEKNSSSMNNFDESIGFRCLLQTQ